MTFNPFSRQKTASEMEEESERLGAEDERLGTQLSIAQKRVAIAELKKRGLTPKHFSFDWTKIVQWLKTH